MKEGIVFLVLSLIAYAFRLLFKNLDKDQFKDKIETVGMITKIIDSEYGNIKYYVSFLDNEGKQMKGESIYYSSTKGKYDEGDLVKFKYSIIREWYAQVSVVDNELIPCRNSYKEYSRNMLISTIVFLIISAIFFVKNILL